MFRKNGQDDGFWYIRVQKHPVVNFRQDVQGITEGKIGLLDLCLDVPGIPFANEKCVLINHPFEHPHEVRPVFKHAQIEFLFILELKFPMEHIPARMLIVLDQAYEIRFAFTGDL